jgi:cytochrome c553
MGLFEEHGDEAVGVRATLGWRLALACLGLLLGLLSCDAALAQAPVPLQTPAADQITVPDSIEARVAACLPCHGERGRGVRNVYFPRLAGKPAGYLYHQLLAFRDGRRHYAPMNYLLAYLPDAYLRKMADYYAQQPLPAVEAPPPVASPDVLRRGQGLVRNGDPQRDIPACMACHGPELGGREPGIPGLLGLRYDYITSQLGAWRYGTRTALAPDCMQQIASRLTEQDVAAVAAWLASQPVVPGMRPLRGAPARLPLACGSQQP